MIWIQSYPACASLKSMDLAKRGNWLVQFNSESSPALFSRRRKEFTTFEEWRVAVLRRLELSIWSRLLLLRFLDRLAVYQLTDKIVIRVLTSRYDLSALPIVMLYKVKMVDRKWRLWVKRLYKVKKPHRLRPNTVKSFLT